MEANFVKKIENSIKEKNQDDIIITEIKDKLNIDIKQAKLMIKYIKRFCILSSILDSQYMNYFNKINLFDVREKDELTDENFAKAIVLFIKEKQRNKKLYMVKLNDEKDIKINILILSQLDYYNYEYNVEYNKELNLKNNLNIFKYIYNLIDEYEFKSLSNELISNKIDSPLIPYLNLTNSNYQDILDYSKKYPNRIRYLDCYGFDPEKLKELLELNKNSLKSYPHGIFKYLIPLPNAKIFNIINFNLDESNQKDCNFSKIKEVIIDNIGINQENNYINFLNNFNNLETIEFWDIDSETLFKIIENIKCKKVKIIKGTCEDLDDEYNYEKVFQNLPLLESFNIEEHQTMNWTYEISPIFLAERKRLSFPLLEQLIRNYLKGSKERTIKLQFDDEFDQFWEYFKEKKDIISRISELYGAGVYFSLDTYFKGFINQEKKINEIPKAKYIYFFVYELFNEQIFEFIKNNKIEYLFIQKGCDVNIKNFVNCESLKFVFDNSSKIFLFKLNGILQNF